VKRLHVPLSKVMPFVVLADHKPRETAPQSLVASRSRPAQASLF
jgi:hypothetical protein